MRSLYLLFGFYVFFVFQVPAVSRLGIVGYQKDAGKSVDSVSYFNRLHAWRIRFEANMPPALLNKMSGEYVTTSLGVSLKLLTTVNDVYER